MTVQEYLDFSQLSEESFAERVGIKVGAVRLWKSREMPPKWDAAIQNSVNAKPVGLEELDRATDWEPVGETPTSGVRETEYTPQPPKDARIVAPPKAAVSLATVRGYIVMIYEGGARVARQTGDGLAAETIERYTPDFADAWVAYLESKPELIAWLSKLQVGTPFGNLVGVHVIAAGSYVLARQTAISMASRAAADARAAENNGQAFADSPPSFVGNPESETSP